MSRILPPITETEQIFVTVSEDSHDNACKDGWVNVEHPVRRGVIMQRLPCGRCNQDLSKPDSEFNKTELYFWSH